MSFRMVSVLSWALVSCSVIHKFDSKAPNEFQDKDKNKGPSSSGLTLTGEYAVLNDYAGTRVPLNREGVTYPVSYFTGDFRGSSEGGDFIPALTDQGCILARCLLMSVTRGFLYAQFNPYDGTTRAFARDYSVDPSKWKFNTYNRMRIWLKVPTNFGRLSTDGTTNANFGTYVKRIANASQYSDEEGGFHGYHNLNLPPLGTWVQIVLNQHPDHSRGTNGGDEEPDQPHPTGEANYNYYDALTRFYISANADGLSLPTEYRLGSIVFYQESSKENEDQVRSISSTYHRSSNRIVVTWFRNKDENNIQHEVRYAFSDIHTLGWNAANAAPGGVLTPPGYQGYNGMTYDTTQIDVRGQKVLYVAIKPTNSSAFTQVGIPLDID